MLRCLAIIMIMIMIMIMLMIMIMSLIITWMIVLRKTRVMISQNMNWDLQM